MSERKPKNKLDYIGSITNFIGQWHNYATLTTLGQPSLRIADVIVKTFTVRIDGSPLSLSGKPDLRNYDETRDTPHFPLLPPSLRISHALKDFVVLPHWVLFLPFLAHGQWSVDPRENKFPIKQVSAVAAESRVQSSGPSDPQR